MYYRHGRRGVETRKDLPIIHSTFWTSASTRCFSGSFGNRPGYMGYGGGEADGDVRVNAANEPKSLPQNVILSRVERG